MDDYIYKSPKLVRFPVNIIGGIFYRQGSSTQSFSWGDDYVVDSKNMNATEKEWLTKNEKWNGNRSSEFYNNKEQE